jgi:Tfp pilus assembly protein PilZ
VDGVVKDCAFKSLAKNASLGGVFIEAPVAFAIDEEIALIFTLPDQGEPIRVVGKIVWNAPSGLGVAFQHTPERLATMVEALP